jgi:hypothetical protein
MPWRTNKSPFESAAKESFVILDPQPLRTFDTVKRNSVRKQLDTFWDALRRASQEILKKRGK